MSETLSGVTQFRLLELPAIKGVEQYGQELADGIAQTIAYCGGVLEPWREDPKAAGVEFHVSQNRTVAVMTAYRIQTDTFLFSALVLPVSA